MSGETYIPYVVGSAIGSFSVSSSYFSTIDTYINYPGFFVGYSYAYGEYEITPASSHLSYSRYSYLGADGQSGNTSDKLSNITSYHTTRIKNIGSLYIYLSLSINL